MLATSDDICAIGANFPIEKESEGREKGREEMDGRRLTSDRTGRLLASQPAVPIGFVGHRGRILRTSFLAPHRFLWGDLRKSVSVLPGRPNDRPLALDT